MSTNLTRIGVRRQGRIRIWCLLRCITTSRTSTTLRECFRRLKGEKALGVDGVSKAMYEKDLEANLRDLSARLKRMGYRPKPKRRTYIPKPGSEKGRPLGISSFEDKIVELAAKRVLEPLFESLFEDCSYGYRPRRNPHHCLDAVGTDHPTEASERGRRSRHSWLLRSRESRMAAEVSPATDRGPASPPLDRPHAQSRRHGRRADASRARRGHRRDRLFPRSCPISTSTTFWISGSSVGFDGNVGAKRICSDTPTILWPVSSIKRMPNTFERFSVGGWRTSNWSLPKRRRRS